MQPLPPVRFRLHADDHGKYGAEWYVYDENAILRLPVGELRDIERAVGTPIIDVMNRGRQSYVDGTLAQMWIARRMAGITEPFADFEPLVMLADWEVVPAADADPPAESGPSSPPAARKRSSAGTSRSSRSTRTSRREN